MRRSSIAITSACLVLCGVAAAGPAVAQKAGTGAILPGGNAKKPINIEALKLDYFDKEQKLVYTGNVVASQGEATLKATMLTIFLAPKKAGQSAGGQSTNQVQRMIAAGPVTLLQRDQVGTGDNGVYDKTKNSVILTGNVVLTQGPNVTKGDRLDYDLKSGQARVTGGPGRVKSLFVPDDDSAKSAAPEAGADATAGRRSTRSARRGE